MLNLLVGALLLAYLVNVFRTSPQGALAALDLNIYNLLFLTVGLLLHWRPRNFVRAVTESIPATGGVLIQFPFYAMIFGMIVGTGLSAKLAHLFTSASTHDTFALLAAGYSAVLGIVSFPRAAANGLWKRPTYSKPPSRTRCIWGGWCRFTT